MKVCLKCKQEKSLHEFNKKTRNKDGLAHYSNIRIVTTEENQAKKHKKTAEGEALCSALLGREWIKLEV